MSKGGMMMSFLNYSIYLVCNSKPLLEKTSLQAYPKKFDKYSRNSTYLYSKRMSSFLFSQMDGSMTVEASIAIPLFMFAIINLLSVILLFGEYSSGLADMHMRAKELSVHAHALTTDSGIGNDYVVMTKVMELEPLIPIMGFDGGTTIISCHVRKWTGYDVTGMEGSRGDEERVYITPTGEGYHRNPNCSYLNPKIMSAVSSEINNYRNNSGEIYRACERCDDITLTGICFYTEYGNRYHTTLNCSGLKRTIMTIPISEVGSRHLCNKCKSSGE